MKDNRNGRLSDGEIFFLMNVILYNVLKLIGYLILLNSKDIFLKKEF